MALPLAGNPPIDTLLDDSGTGLDGTEVTSALFQQFATAIDDAVYDPTNPDETPALITTDVVNARDGYPTLKDKIDAVAASVLQQAPNFSTENLLINDDFSVWTSAATNTNPAGWTGGGGLGPSAVGFVRSTTDLGAGPSCLRVTVGTLVGGPSQQVVPKGSGAFIAVPNLFGRNFSTLATVKATAPNTVRIEVSDGVNTYYSAFNTGVATERLAFTGAIAANAIFLRMRVIGVAGSVFEVGPCTLGLTALPLENWIPARKTLLETTLPIDGTTLNAECRFVMPLLPAMVRQVVATGKTSSATLEIAIEKWHRSNGGLDPTNFRAMYLANIKFGGHNAGGQAVLEPQVAGGIPDGNIEDRCTGIGGGDFDVIRARVAVLDAAVVEMKVTFRFVTWSRLLENLIGNGF